MRRDPVETRLQALLEEEEESLLSSSKGSREGQMQHRDGRDVLKSSGNYAGKLDHEWDKEGEINAMRHMQSEEEKAMEGDYERGLRAYTRALIRGEPDKAAFHRRHFLPIFFQSPLLSSEEEGVSIANPNMVSSPSHKPVCWKVEKEGKARGGAVGRPLVEKHVRPPVRRQVSPQGSPSRQQELHSGLERKGPSQDQHIQPTYLPAPDESDAISSRAVLELKQFASEQRLKREKRKSVGGCALKKVSDLETRISPDHLEEMLPPRRSITPSLDWITCTYSQSVKHRLMPQYVTAEVSTEGGLTRHQFECRMQRVRRAQWGAMLKDLRLDDSCYSYGANDVHIHAPSFTPLQLA